MEETIGSRIKKLRAEKEMTQDDLARKAGIPYATLMKIENVDLDRFLDSINKTELVKYFYAKDVLPPLIEDQNVNVGRVIKIIAGTIEYAGDTTLENLFEFVLPPLIMAQNVNLDSVLDIIEKAINSNKAGDTTLENLFEFVLPPLIMAQNVNLGRVLDIIEEAIKSNKADDYTLGKLFKFVLPPLIGAQNVNLDSVLDIIEKVIDSSKAGDYTLGNFFEFVLLVLVNAENVNLERVVNNLIIPNEKYIKQNRYFIPFNYIYEKIKKRNQELAKSIEHI